jgi:hypothetical protein
MKKNVGTINHNKYPLQKAYIGQYIYHLSYNKYRSSIEEKTLLGYRDMKPISERGLVFAHNTEQISLDWYWLCLDAYETQFYGVDDESLSPRDQLRLFVNKYYDIWRIDNDIANKTWYIDQIAFEDCYTEIKQDYYVKCFGNIKKEALTLCAVDDELLESIQIVNGSIQRTYYNKIIPRQDYILKHGSTPEHEHLFIKNNAQLLELAFNDEKGFMNLWKQLKHKKISLKEVA